MPLAALVDSSFESVSTGGAILFYIGLRGGLLYISVC